MTHAALTHHAAHAHTEEQREAARALLTELARGQISRTAACSAITAAARRRSERDEAQQ
jgi:hypothetical protein